MPRKAQPPRVLRIETLSDGKEYRPVQVDDFTGQAMAPVVLEDGRQTKPLPDGWDIRDAINREKAKDARLLLIACGMGHLVGYTPPPKHVPPKIEGMRTVSVINNDKVKVAFQVKMPPWRRF